MKQERSNIKPLALALCLVFAVCGCSEESADAIAAIAPQCVDGIDNDNDSLVDLNDAGCASASDDDESNIPVSTAHDAARANSYDDSWESAWVANAKAILAAPVGITKIAGKVLQVGDSMTYSFAYGDWARHKTGATVSDVEIANWMHAGASDTTDGWALSSNGTTAINNAGWGAFIDSIIVDSSLNDAQFAVVMFNATTNLAFVEGEINKLINVGIVPVLSTIPPRTDLDYNRDVADPYNVEILALAEKLSLPIMDYSKEILLRRPNGTWENTLISTDGVHPSGTVNGYSTISDPYADGGEAATHTTGDATFNSGYLLRTWLTVQKMKEVKQKVVDWPAR